MPPASDAVGGAGTSSVCSFPLETKGNFTRVAPEGKAELETA